MPQPRASAGLPRREFLRRSAMGAMAFAALGAGAAATGVGSVLTDLAKDPGDGLPADPLAAVALLGDRALAVGGVRGEPRVWGRSPGQGSWELVAGTDDFPAGTALNGLDVVASTAIAVGCTGFEHATRPAAFSSSDGVRWDLRASDHDGVPGLFTGVVARHDRVLAVGARFAEDEVQEPTETIAVEGEPGGSLTTLDLVGVPRVRHGAVTLLALDGDRPVIGLTDVSGIALFRANELRGPWHPIGAPGVQLPFAPVAAAAVDGSLLVVGIDGQDRTRYWRRAGTTWSEVEPPAGVPAHVTVHDLRRRGEVLVVAGDREDDGYLREVTV